jgi:hypothetical protein
MLVITVRPMRTIAMVVVALLAAAACGGSEKGTPDAPLFWGVHDQDFSAPCDPDWAVDGHMPYGCEVACQVRPVDVPCMGRTPCNLKPACNKAATTGGPTFNCPSTFIATDYMGDHRGCCAIRYALGPERPIPTFYECPTVKPPQP